MSRNRDDLETPGQLLSLFPRNGALMLDQGAFIAEHGKTIKATYEALTPSRRTKLASQIKVDQAQLEGLVDDAAAIFAVWALTRPQPDVYSDPDVQAVVNAGIAFLEHVHFLSRKGPRPQPKTPVEHTFELSFLGKRQTLAPLMELINPGWRDPDQWDVRPALKLALSLTDKPGHGEVIADGPSDRAAALALCDSWHRRTGRQPSAGEKRSSSPYRFYLALFGSLEPTEDHLFIRRPSSLAQRLNDVVPKAFAASDIESFREVVIAQRALGRAIGTWVTTHKNRAVRS